MYHNQKNIVLARHLPKTRTQSSTAVVLNLYSLPNPCVILLWFEKIFLIFRSLGPFLFKFLDFVLVFILELFFFVFCFIFYRPFTFFLVFDIFLLLFDLSFLICPAPASSGRARIIRITIKEGATFRF